MTNKPNYDNSLNVEIDRVKNDLAVLNSELKNKERNLEDKRTNLGCVLIVIFSVIFYYLVFQFTAKWIIDISFFLWLLFLSFASIIFDKLYPNESSAKIKYATLYAKKEIFSQKLDELIKKELKVQEEYYLKLNAYFIDRGEELNLFWSQILSTLDSIHNNHLYNKRLLVSNTEQWAKWIEYLDLLKSIEIDISPELQYDRDLHRRVYNHWLYAKNRNIHQGQKRKDSNELAESGMGANNSGNQKNKVPVVSPQEKALLTLETFLTNLLSSSKSVVDFNQERTKLGILGEEFIMKEERLKLKKIGIHSDKYPVHVSSEHGDEFGFDILTINQDLQPMMLEIKTTTKSKNTPFFLTINEIQKLREYHENYRIVRVFDFDSVSLHGKYEYIDQSQLEKNYYLKEQLFKAYVSP